MNDPPVRGLRVEGKPMSVARSRLVEWISRYQSLLDFCSSLLRADSSRRPPQDTVRILFTCHDLPAGEWKTVIEALRKDARQRGTSPHDRNRLGAAEDIPRYIMRDEAIALLKETPTAGHRPRIKRTGAATYVTIPAP